MNDDRTDGDRRPKKRRRHDDHATHDTDTNGDSERICGACGEPIRSEPFFTAWGPVHKLCRDKPE